MARALWKGRITLGALSVPVKLMTAVRPKDIAFHQLSPEGDCRLRTKLVCPDTNEEYGFGQTAKGYEIAPDQYVLVSKEEMDKLKVEASETIRIDRFVKAQELDPVFFEKAYYLAPDDDPRPYNLLVRAMGPDRVGVGEMVMRGRAYLVGVRATDSSLLVHTMYYPDEVVSAKEAGALVEHVKPSKTEVDMAEHLIQMLSRDFKIEEYRDTMRQKVQELIERKAAGEKVAVVKGDEDVPPTYNLAAALKASLKQVGAEAPVAKTRRRAKTIRRPTRGRRKVA